MDLIDRQAAIDALAEDMPLSYTPDGSHPADEGIFMAQEIYADCIETIKILPSAEPDRLTDDDFETIRIHLNAFKEKLCNQHRWKEAEEYQRIIDRLMSFASTEPETEEKLGFLEFLWDVINPNEMEQYWSMYHCGGEEKIDG